MEEEKKGRGELGGTEERPAGGRIEDKRREEGSRGEKRGRGGDLCPAGKRERRTLER